jgi:hypothetical protein
METSASFEARSAPSSYPTSSQAGCQAARVETNTRGKGLHLVGSNTSG